MAGSAGLPHAGGGIEAQADFGAGPDIVTLEISEGRGGADIAVCRWRGQEYQAAARSGSASAMLARQLVAAGAPDGRMEARRRGRLAYTVASLHNHAKLTLTEGGRWRPYRPFQGEE